MGSSSRYEKVCVRDRERERLLERIWSETIPTRKRELVLAGYLTLALKREREESLCSLTRMLFVL